jgi:hypothetical protein
MLVPSVEVGCFQVGPWKASRNTVLQIGQPARITRPQLAKRIEYISCSSIISEVFAFLSLVALCWISIEE